MTCYLGARFPRYLWNVCREQGMVMMPRGAA
jgi:hypothetical protein